MPTTFEHTKNAPTTFDKTPRNYNSAVNSASLGGRSAQKARLVGRGGRLNPPGRPGRPGVGRGVPARPLPLPCALGFAAAVPRPVLPTRAWIAIAVMMRAGPAGGAGGAGKSPSWPGHGGWPMGVGRCLRGAWLPRCRLARLCMAWRGLVTAARARECACVYNSMLDYHHGLALQVSVLDWEGA